MLTVSQPPPKPKEKDKDEVMDVVEEPEVSITSICLFLMFEMFLRAVEGRRLPSELPLRESRRARPQCHVGLRSGVPI